MSLIYNLPFSKEYHCTARSPRSYPQKKGLEENMAFNTQGCTQGDRLIRSLELSNRHMSFFFTVKTTPSFGTRPCITYNVRHPSMLGTGPWGREMGTWHHPFPTRPSIYFLKTGPGPVHGTSPLV